MAMRPQCQVCKSPATHAWRKDFRCDEHAEAGLHRHIYPVFAEEYGEATGEPIGFAANERSAARQIADHCGDPDFTKEFVVMRDTGAGFAYFPDS